MSEFSGGDNQDRRSFVQRLVGMAGFAVPTVRTFVVAATATVTAENALAQAGTTLFFPTTPFFPGTTNFPSTTSFVTTTDFPSTTTENPFPTTTEAPSGVPEIDPGSAATAVTLLTGAVLIARDRYRPKTVATVETPTKATSPENEQ